MSDGTSRLILVLAAGGFASTFAGRTVEPLVGVLARDFASPPATVALLSTAFALPYALIQPVLGPVGDALGKRVKPLAESLGSDDEKAELAQMHGRLRDGLARRWRPGLSR